MLQDLIKNRRAVFPRQYTGEKISREKIEAILQAGNWAPTHRRTEPWRFKVVYSDEKLKELGDFLAESYQNTAQKYSETKHRQTREKVLQSSCVLLICFKADPKKRVPEWEEIAATAMAVQNMWLTAADLGIGAYWSSPDMRHEIDKFVNLEEGERCLGFFYMGYYEEPLPEGHRGDWQEKIEWL